MLSPSLLHRGGLILRLSFVWLAGALVVACGDQAERATGPADAPSVSLSQGPERLAAVMAIQNKHTQRLLGIRGVVGTATGVAANGNPTILVFTRTRGLGGIPTTLEGAPVRSVVTGDFKAFSTVAAGPTTTSLTGRFRPNIPNGVSVSNVHPSGSPVCLAGTLGAGVVISGVKYALSNNHVFASQNKAPLGTAISQPGLFDTSPQCSYNPATDRIGSLYALVRINFSVFGSNQVDAALATVTSATLTCSTPADIGYGAPSATLKGATVGLPIQKVGRTTALTTGTVTGINATVIVDYGGGKLAWFVNQIVTSPGFSGAGDSGSLIVTNDGTRRPVALLFAGGGDGTTLGNPIAVVLNRLSRQIGGVPISVCTG